MFFLCVYLYFICVIFIIDNVTIIVLCMFELYVMCMNCLMSNVCLNNVLCVIMFEL